MARKNKIGGALLCVAFAAALAGCGKAPQSAPVDSTLISQGIHNGFVASLTFGSTYRDEDLKAHLGSRDLDKMLACKNWEGSLMATPGGEPWEFSLPKGPDTAKFIKAIQDGLEQGHRVSVEYNRVAQNDECQTRTPILVTGVTDLDAGKSVVVIEETTETGKVTKAPFLYDRGHMPPASYTP